MNSKLKVLLSVVAMSFVMVGCGSSGSSGGSSTPPAPVLDNSALADGASDYGYYGTQVMFGDNLMTGEWTLELPNNDYLYRYHYTADGQEIWIGGIFDGSVQPYGVSVDGTEIKTSVTGITRILQKRGNDCYDVEHSFAGDPDEVGTFCKN